MHPPSLLKSVLCVNLVLTGSACFLDFSKDPSAAEGGTDAGDGAGPGGNGGAFNGGSNQPATGGTAGDGGPMTGDGSMAEPMLACSGDGDCADLERLHCVSNVCVEYECHKGRGCSGLDVCETHACVPFVPPERFPAGYSQTNGGGRTTSTRYRLRASFGTPQPFGKAQSSKYHVVLGPGAGTR